METRLEQYGAKLDRLVAKAKEAGAEARTDYRKRIDDLKAKYRVSQSKLDDLRAAGSERWDTVKAGVESAWAELEAAFKKLTN
jgi:histidinol dehydrogenase